MVVLFGATGDLARRLVIPALFDLHRSGLADLVVIGNGRGERSDADFRAEALEACRANRPGAPVAGPEWESFASRLLFAGHGFTVDDPGELPARLAEADARLATGEDKAPDHLWYLAVPPVQFEPARTPSVGAETELAPVDLELPLRDIAGQASPPAHVGLLLHVMLGDRSRFTRPDGLRHVWDALAPLLDVRRAPIGYAVGSRGPSAADRLVAPTGWLSEEPTSRREV